MTRYIHLSLLNELEHIKSIESNLKNINIGIANFFNDKDLDLDDSIKQVNFKAHKNTLALDENDLDFISNGSDVIGLWERSPGLHRKANFYRFLFEATLLLEKIKSFVIENEIKEIWYNMVPHSFEDYLFATTVERYGGKVLYLGPAFLPWSQTLWEGLLSKKRITNISENLYKSNFIKLSLLNKAENNPGSELQNQQNKEFKISKLLFRNPLDLFKRVHLFFWKNEYKKLSTSILDKDSLIIYLHYQPEATNLPFFDSLTAQFSIIKRLKELSQFSVYIKEHPNQLIETPPVKAGARWIGIYKDLIKNYQIKILNLEFPIKRAIKENAVVFSIGGSVIFEYLNMGGKVILPAESPIFSKDYLSKFNSRVIGENLYEIDQDSFPDLLEEEMKSSITRNDENLNYSPIDRFANTVNCMLELN